MACGGGAALAAVYNVPLGGALFTAEIMLGTITVPAPMPWSGRPPCSARPRRRRSPAWC